MDWSAHVGQEGLLMGIWSGILRVRSAWLPLKRGRPTSHVIKEKFPPDILLIVSDEDLYRPLCHYTGRLYRISPLILIVLYIMLSGRIRLWFWKWCSLFVELCAWCVFPGRQTAAPCWSHHRPTDSPVHGGNRR